MQQFILKCDQKYCKDPLLNLYFFSLLFVLVYLKDLAHQN